MTTTFSTFMQSFANWALVKRLFNKSEQPTQDRVVDDAELENFLKAHFDQGVFLNGSSSF